MAIDCAGGGGGGGGGECPFPQFPQLCPPTSPGTPGTFNIVVRDFGDSSDPPDCNKGGGYDLFVTVFDVNNNPLDPSTINLTLVTDDKSVEADGGCFGIDGFTLSEGKRK